MHPRLLNTLTAMVVAVVVSVSASGQVFWEEDCNDKNLGILTSQVGEQGFIWHGPNLQPYDLNATSLTISSAFGQNGTKRAGGVDPLQGIAIRISISSGLLSVDYEIKAGSSGGHPSIR